MDPDACWAELRDAAAEAIRLTDSPEGEEEHREALAGLADTMAQRVSDLSEWMARGGRPPHVFT